ncbi:SH3 domain-containing protein [Salinimicrobium catena]|uniref:SH3 domain-containing protein n=1 Tax=Salinimicrobium catena TaxID=390640 RepID=A0A1H5M6B0_9FLAO|nr:C40 family peptidase [Salinimicrobium catena]SDL18958.1 SH3 domain-containing protein [Salinimicrobium catena]SEE84673.1 SH3 domain-containing protein [Salinimicrobium catena]
MQYAICNLGIVPLRLEPTNTSEMVSQMLYGEYFKILEERGKWSRIRTAFDSCEAWVDNKQYHKISEEDYNRFETEEAVLSADLIEFISGENQNLMPVPLGSVLNFTSVLNHSHGGNQISGKQDKSNLIETAFLYLNAPFLWGGKTPFGIDSSGFTQMVYKLNGHKLCRNAADQAKQGESLSFIEESEPGDLAFFDDKDGVITHVGIMMNDNYIIHADGKVRLDRIDHSGIYNADLRRHTHKLRVIKKII